MTDIIIKKADKGTATVVMNKSDYLKEGYRQLSDSAFYKKLDSDPTLRFNTYLQKEVESLFQRGEISLKGFRYQ